MPWWVSRVVALRRVLLFGGGCLCRFDCTCKLLVQSYYDIAILFISSPIISFDPTIQHIKSLPKSTWWNTPILHKFNMAAIENHQCCPKEENLISCTFNTSVKYVLCFISQQPLQFMLSNAIFVIVLSIYKVLPILCIICVVIL